MKYTYLINGPMKTLADENNNLVDIIYYPDLRLMNLSAAIKGSVFLTIQASMYAMPLII